MVNSKYSSSSKRWLKQYFSDRYVQQVKKRKIRSRAWFKLDQINNMDFLLRSGMNVIDLGAAPGSWSEYSKKVSKCDRVIACDILPMNKIIGVDFLQGNICNSDVLQRFFQVIDGKVEIVLSDMSPNISGIVDVDVSKSIYLGECALNICRHVLIPGGSFLVKIFQGEGFDEYCRSVRALFNTVKIRKPIASHIHSPEVYIVAKGYDM